MRFNLRHEAEVVRDTLFSWVMLELISTGLAYAIGLVCLILGLNQLLPVSSNMTFNFFIDSYVQGLLVQFKLSLDLIPLLESEIRKDLRLRREIINGAMNGDYRSVPLTVVAWICLFQVKPLLVLISTLATFVLIYISRKTLDEIVETEEPINPRFRNFCCILSNLLKKSEWTINWFIGYLPEAKVPKLRGQELTKKIRNQIRRAFGIFANLMGIDNIIGVSSLLNVNNVFSFCLGVMTSITFTGVYLIYTSTRAAASDEPTKPPILLLFAGVCVLIFVSLESFHGIFEIVMHEYIRPWLNHSASIILNHFA